MEITSAMISAATGILGVAVGFGALRAIVARNTFDLKQMLKRMNCFDKKNAEKFVPRTECVLIHDKVTEALSDLEEHVDRQQNITRRLENFALYQLTVKDGMSLSDAQSVLENGGR
jgi:hypothetical protein